MGKTLKILAQRCLLLLFVVSLLLSCGLAKAQAEVNYLGEICFSMISNDLTKARKAVQLGVLSFGTGHFPLHGKATVEGFTGIIPVHGTAEIDSSNGIIVMTLTSSDRLTDSTTIYIEINANTLSGIYKEIDHLEQVIGAPISNPIITSTDSGSITLHACL